MYGALRKYYSILDDDNSSSSLELAHAFLLSYALYDMTILQFGHSEELDRTPNSLNVTLLTGGCLLFWCRYILLHFTFILLGSVSNELIS